MVRSVSYFTGSGSLAAGLATWHLFGAVMALYWLGRWRPYRLTFVSTVLTGSRLLDGSRVKDLAVWAMLLVTVPWRMTALLGLQTTFIELLLVASVALVAYTALLDEVYTDIGYGAGLPALPTALRKTVVCPAVRLRRPTTALP